MSLRTVAHRALRSGPHWIRVEMDRAIAEQIKALPVRDLDAAEVSGDAHARWPWRSFTSLTWPDFDLAGDTPLPEPVDVVLCEQVLEHVPDPIKAVKRLHAMLRPGGRVIVSTPFLVRLHGDEHGYGDFWRFTPDGMRLLLQAAGFSDIEVGAWGNRLVVALNLRRWVFYKPGMPLANNPRTPVSVWATATRR